MRIGGRRQAGGRPRRLIRVLGPGVVACLASAAQGGEAIPLYKDVAQPVEQRVADLLGRMTLEEKVAQTHALWHEKAGLVDAAGRFDPERAARALRHGLGMIARPSDGFEAIDGVADPSRIERKGPRETAAFVNAVQRWVIENTRLGIPVLFHEEALHGLAARGGTHFPVPVALASTWDPELVERVFTTVARETRARGVHQVLSPVLDLARDPRWGRFEETYGEDPYLVGCMGAAAIRGYQGPGPALGRGRVFATTKHYAVHGQPEGGINTAPGNFSERVVREEFLHPFRIAIAEAGAMSVMPSYNEVDAVPSHANPWLLEQVLRREWGFRGFVVSDYYGIEQLRDRHSVVGSLEDAAKTALEAGVDMELPDVKAYASLAAQVRRGRIGEKVLDRAVARILRAKFLAGLFEAPYADPEEAERVTNTAEHQALALEAARRSIILLKNEGGVLPLDPAALRSLAVIGPNAADVHLGGYSEDPGRGISVLQGIREHLAGGVEVRHAEGCRITEHKADWWADEVVPGDPETNRQRIAAAVEVARSADAVVLVLGGNESTSREAWSDTHLGDATTLDLPGQQDQLVEAVLATGKPVVAVLIHGRPHAITRLAEIVPAILEGWYLGQEGGTAVAEVLFGAVNPGGKLPVSVPRSVGQIPVYYSRKPTSQRDYLFAPRAPLFPFGHGLSYTRFTLSHPRLEPPTIGPAGETTLRVDVTNSGEREGDEVVQVYLRDRVSSVTRPVKELKAFDRVRLAPHETKTVELTLGPEALAFLDAHMERVVEPGLFDVMVGTSSASVQSLTLEVVAR
jgi:beta-glucosidase